MARCMLGGGDSEAAGKLPSWRGCISGIGEGGEGGMGLSHPKSCPGAN